MNPIPYRKFITETLNLRPQSVAWKHLRTNLTCPSHRERKGRTGVTSLGFGSNHEETSLKNNRSINVVVAGSSSDRATSRGEWATSSSSSARVNPTKQSHCKMISGRTKIARCQFCLLSTLTCRRAPILKSRFIRAHRIGDLPTNGTTSNRSLTRTFVILCDGWIRELLNTDRIPLFPFWTHSKSPVLSIFRSNHRFSPAPPISPEFSKSKAIP